MENRTRMIKLRVTEKEAATWKEAAEKSGISVSELIRRTMQNKPPIVISYGNEELKKMYGTIVRIGNLQVKIDEVMYKTQMHNDVSPMVKQQAINLGFRRIKDLRLELIPEIKSLKAVLTEILRRIN